jgi:aryl-alcohol dehydrogenase-like predicted oxidoreductase
MAIAWLLQNKGVTTALIGASKPEQIKDCVGALKNLSFSRKEPCGDQQDPVLKRGQSSQAATSSQVLW